MIRYYYFIYLSGLLLYHTYIFTFVFICDVYIISQYYLNISRINMLYQ